MNTYSFRKDLLAVQEELLRFAYKLTSDREEANDLLQEPLLKPWIMKTNTSPIPILKVGCTPLCVTSLSITTAR